MGPKRPGKGKGIRQARLSLVATPRVTGLRARLTVAFIRDKITKNERGANLSRSNRFKPSSGRRRSPSIPRESHSEKVGCSKVLAHSQHTVWVSEQGPLNANPRPDAQRAGRSDGHPIPQAVAPNPARRELLG
jgi:hypothetical protein